MPIPVAIGAALAAGGVNLGTTIWQNRANRRAQDRAFEQNKQFWQERFDKEAEYSSPVQQMARLKAAGLNPALMYKSGAGGAGNISGPSAQGKVAEKYDMAQLGLISAQTAKIMQDAKKAEAEKGWIESKTEGQGTTNEILIQELGVKEIENLNASEKMKLSIKKDWMEIAQKMEAINLAKSQGAYWKAKEQEIKNINYEWNALQKKLIDQGVDRDAPWFQSVKQWMMSNWADWTEGMSWENFKDPTKDLWGNRPDWYEEIEQ